MESTISNRRITFLLTAIGLVLASLLFQKLVSPPAPQYRAFTLLQWEESSGCSLHQDFGRATIQHPASQCSSTWFKAKNAVFDFEYAAQFEEAGRRDLFIQLEQKGKGIIAEFRPPDKEDTGHWQRSEVEVTQGQEYRLHLRGSKFKVASLRSRINFYQSNTAAKENFSYLHRPGVKQLALLFCAFIFCYAFFVVVERSPSTQTVALYFLFLACALHYRPLLFFHADEWFVLDRLYGKGLSAVLISHNEHFIPMYSLLYYLQYKVFQEHYGMFVLVSVFLHTANALLLLRLLQRLGNRVFSPTACYIVALVYLVSGLHASSIQWTLCQSSLLCVFFSLSSLIASWDYLSKGDNGTLALACLSLLGSVLSFGAAFVMALQIPLLALLRWSKSEKNINKQHLSRLLFCTWATIGICAVLYLLYRDGWGFKVEEAGEGSLKTFIGFTAYGSQFGTLLRGLGLYPVTHFSVTQKFFPTMDYVSLMCVFIALGALVGLALLVYYWRAKEHRLYRLLLWCVGQLYIVLPFVLIAIGRSRFQAGYAESLRFQALPLIGLMILILPLLADITKQPGFCRPTKALVGLLSFYFFSQLFFAQNFDHFVLNGRSTRRYFAQVRDWNLTLDRTKDSPILFQGEGTRYEGHFPIWYDGNNQLRGGEFGPDRLLALSSLE